MFELEKNACKHTLKIILNIYEYVGYGEIKRFFHSKGTDFGIEKSLYKSVKCYNECVDMIFWMKTFDYAPSCVYIFMKIRVHGDIECDFKSQSGFFILRRTENPENFVFES